MYEHKLSLTQEAAWQYFSRSQLMSYVFRKKHVNIFSWKKPTEQKQKLVTQRQQKFQIWKTTNAKTLNRYTLWKTSVCQMWGSTRETLPESRNTLDMSKSQFWIVSKSQYWLDKTTFTWSHQSQLNKDHLQHQLQVFSNIVGLFLDPIEYWMITKHNNQFTILLCFAAIALNKTMTSMKKSPIGGKQRQYRSKPKANQMIQRFCLSTIYLTQLAWDKRMDVIKQDLSGKTTAVCQTTGQKLWLIFTILSTNYKTNLNSTINTMRAFKQTYKRASLQKYQEPTNLNSFSYEKTRVAPLRQTTIPRQKMQAELYATRLKKTIEDKTGFNFDKIFLWSDNTTVLSWITTFKLKHKMYIGNRICEIRDLTSTNQWNYVNTKDNPADQGTRGLTAT